MIMNKMALAGWSSSSSWRAVPSRAPPWLGRPLVSAGGSNKWLRVVFGAIRAALTSLQTERASPEERVVTLSDGSELLALGRPLSQLAFFRFRAALKQLLISSFGPAHSHSHSHWLSLSLRFPAGKSTTTKPTDVEGSPSSTCGGCRRVRPAHLWQLSLRPALACFWSRSSV